MTRLLTIRRVRSIASDEAVEGEWRVVGSGRLVAESALRAAIADGDLLPGDRLVEADLVAMLGVSRGNVRLAIDALDAEGLVERIPNRGARVRVISTTRRSPSPRPDAARGPARPQGGRAGHRRRGRPAARTSAHHGRAPSSPATSSSTRSSSSSCTAWSREAARHPVAADLVGRLQAQLVRHQFRLSLRPGRPQVSLGELTDLVDAIADRDPDRAEAAAVTHFRSVIAALSESTQHPGGPA